MDIRVFVIVMSLGLIGTVECAPVRAGSVTRSASEVFIDGAVREALVALSLKIDDLCDAGAAADLFADNEEIVDLSGVVLSKLAPLSRQLRDERVLRNSIYLDDAHLLVYESRVLADRTNKLAVLVTTAAGKRGDRRSGPGGLEAKELRDRAVALKVALIKAEHVVAVQAKHDGVILSTEPKPSVEACGAPASPRTPASSQTKAKAFITAPTHTKTAISEGQSAGAHAGTTVVS